MINQQLTFAAADRIPGRKTSGWGICHRSGNVNPNVERTLEEGVTLSLPTTMPDFPTPAELAHRPVRLRYRHSRVFNCGLFWRSVEAGRDHTNRPGNVFTHAAALQIPAHTRPADYHASPDWLAPFRPEQVRSAIPGDGLRTASVRGADSVFGWLHGRGADTRSSVPWMIDAMLGVIGAGHPIAIKVAHTEDALGWISLFGLVLPTRMAKAVAFSSWEDAQSLEGCLAAGHELIGILDPVVATHLPGSVTLLDPTWSVRPVDDGERRWPVPRARAVPVSSWSDVVMDLIWLEPVIAKSVLAQRDEAFAQLRSLEVDHMVAARVGLQVGMLSTRGAVVVDRQHALEALNLTSLPHEALDLPVIAPLATEMGLGQRPRMDPVVSRSSPQDRHHVSGMAPEPDWSPSSGAVQQVDLTRSVATPTTPPPSPSAAQVDVVQRPSIEVDLEKTAPMPLLEPDDEPEQTSPVVRDLLDDQPYPTPTSAVQAALVLSRLGKLESIVAPRWELNRLTSLPWPGQLALLYLIALDDDVLLTDIELAAIHEAVSPHPEAERSAPALMLLAARADVAHPPADHGHDRAGAPWYRFLGGYCEQLDRYDLDFLTFYIDPLTRRVTYPGKDAYAYSRQIIAWAGSPPTLSTWSLTCRTRENLAVIVASVLDPSFSADHRS